MLARARQSCLALRRSLPVRPAASLAASGLPALTEQEMAAAVTEMNEEMDLFFGDQGGAARLADSVSSRTTRPRAEGAADRVQALSSAFALNQELIAQQQQLAGTPAAADPVEDCLTTDQRAGSEAVGAAASPPPELPATDNVGAAPAAPGAASGPVTQVFNGPVTLHQHFHVSVVRPGSQ